MMKFQQTTPSHTMDKNRGMAVIRSIKITIYVLFLGALAGNFFLYYYCPTFLMSWSKDRFVDELSYDAQVLSQYLENSGFTTVSEIARFDNSIARARWSDLADRQALNLYLSREQLRPLGLEFSRAHHIPEMGNIHLYYDLAQILMPGVLSIVPVEKDGDVGALVVGRGTFVGVPVVIFAHKGVIVHIATSNEEALDYFVEHWQ